MGRWFSASRPHAPALVIAALAASASGQVQQDWQASQWQPWRPPITWGPTFGQQLPTATPLDQGFEDVGPSRTSLRQVQVDPRSPVGFEQIYRTADGNLMRQDGAIRAIFPRSAYVVDANGPRPEVPAGTVFHIGPDRHGFAAPLGDPSMPAQGVDRRVQSRIDAMPVYARRNEAQLAGSRASNLASNQATAGEYASLTLFTSETYRRARVASLIQQAVEAPR